eukprot:scaffold226502_cov35-Tisochrysis_lutea.AAC.2
MRLQSSETRCPELDAIEIPPLVEWSILREVFLHAATPMCDTDEFLLTQVKCPSLAPCLLCPLPVAVVTGRGTHGARWTITRHCAYESNVNQCCIYGSSPTPHHNYSPCASGSWHAPLGQRKKSR